ncbi:MAG: hypothetical protein LBH49_02415 [Puniceicoccales bacterium]|nr:hypothetical protein [Puniceicoccales bacterium]
MPNSNGSYSDRHEFPKIEQKYSIVNRVKNFFTSSRVASLGLTEKAKELIETVRGFGEDMIERVRRTEKSKDMIIGKDLCKRLDSFIERISNAIINISTTIDDMQKVRRCITDETAFSNIEDSKGKYYEAIGELCRKYMVYRCRDYNEIKEMYDSIRLRKIKEISDDIHNFEETYKKEGKNDKNLYEINKRFEIFINKYNKFRDIVDEMIWEICAIRGSAIMIMTQLLEEIEECKIQDSLPDINASLSKNLFKRFFNTRGNENEIHDMLNFFQEKIKMIDDNIAKFDAIFDRIIEGNGGDREAFEAVIKNYADMKSFENVKHIFDVYKNAEKYMVNSFESYCRLEKRYGIFAKWHNKLRENVLNFCTKFRNNIEKSYEWNSYKMMYEKFYSQRYKINKIAMKVSRMMIMTELSGISDAGFEKYNVGDKVVEILSEIVSKDLSKALKEEHENFCEK